MSSFWLSVFLVIELLQAALGGVANEYEDFLFWFVYFSVFSVGEALLMRRARVSKVTRWLVSLALVFYLLNLESFALEGEQYVSNLWPKENHPHDRIVVLCGLVTMCAVQVGKVVAVLRRKNA